MYSMQRKCVTDLYTYTHAHTYIHIYTYIYIYIYIYIVEEGLDGHGLL